MGPFPRWFLPCLFLLGLFALLAGPGDGPSHVLAEEGGDPALHLVPRAPAVPGQPYVVDLVAENVTGLAGFQGRLRFDPAALRLSHVLLADELAVGGRDLLTLGPLLREGEVLLGAATCPVADCDAPYPFEGARQSEGRSGRLRLATIFFRAGPAGHPELRLDGVQLVSPTGQPLGDTAAPPALPLAALDLTGNGVVSSSDGWSLATAWVDTQRDGLCAEPPPGEKDLNGSGCLDVGDLQALLARWGEGAEGLANTPARVQATFVVTSSGDQGDSAPGDGLCRTSGGTCTLRAAVQEANQRAGADLIHFDIRGSNGSCPSLTTIQLGSAIPIDDPYHDGLTIDGYSQCGASANTGRYTGNAQLRIELRGNGQRYVPALDILTPNNLIQGLAIFNAGYPIHLSGGNASHNRIAGNFLGTNAANSFLWSTRSDGVHLRYGPRYNVIGCGSYNASNEYLPCTSQAAFNAARNIVSGNGSHGIYLDGDVSQTRITGNFIGLKQDGSTALKNRSDGLDYNHGPQENWLGGPLPGEGNVISGNGSDGIELSHGETVTANHLVGNFFGTDAAGMAALPNSHCGISLEDFASGNTISGNVLSGNGANGIRVYVYSSNNTISDNLIGVGADGVSPLPNGWDGSTGRGRHGILITGASQYTTVERNVIAHNYEEGIRLSLWQESRYGVWGETYFNTIRENSIYENQGVGILLQSDIDPSTGQTVTANQGVPDPNIYEAHTTLVSGMACPGCIVEIFIADKSQVNDPGNDNWGEGKTFIGRGIAAGNGAFAVQVSGVSSGQLVTGTATDSLGNSSQFSRNTLVSGGPPPPTPTPAPPTATPAPPTATPTATPLPAGIFLEQGGLLVMEAEHFSSNTPRSNRAWTAGSRAGHVGEGAMVAAPDGGTLINTNYAANSPELQFPVFFETPGTYYVWVRGWNPDGAGNSVHVGLDGAEILTSNRLSSNTMGSWTWFRSTMDGPVATLDILDRGSFTINVWMREDGFELDRLLLTTSSGYSPGGAGPAESPRSTEPPTPTPTPVLPTATATPIPSATPVAGTVRVRVTSWTDDAEERVNNGNVYRASSDLELTEDGSSGEQLVGLRFQNVSVPPGATISRAWLEFVTDETDSDPTSLLIAGEAADHSAPVGNERYGLSTRARTGASVAWESLPPWSSVGELHSSPEIGPVVAEIVGRAGWVSGNALLLLISGSGERTAVAYDGVPDEAPLLHIEYVMPGGGWPTPGPPREPEPEQQPQASDYTMEPFLWLPLVGGQER